MEYLPPTTAVQAVVTPRPPEALSLKAPERKPYTYIPSLKPKTLVTITIVLARNYNDQFLIM